MMKTYFDIIRNISNLRWSIVDPDPTSFAEVQKAVKLAAAQANSYIWSLEDFPFKIKKEIVSLKKGQTALVAPKGNLIEVWIEGGKSYLEEVTAKQADFFSSEKEGQPAYFWLEFGDLGAELHLYPKPDQPYTLMMRYTTDYKARSQQGDLKVNLEDMDDTLNLPDDRTIEDLYLHCLNTKAMEYLIADTTDENYQPYQKEFLEAYRSLLKLTGVKIEPRLVI